MIKFENVTLHCNDAERMGSGASDRLSFRVDDFSGEVSFSAWCERPENSVFEHITVSVTSPEARQFAQAILDATA